MITVTESVKRMKKIGEDFANDPEMAHLHADDLLCEVLQESGFARLAAQYCLMSLNLWCM
jgi:hypothetical protein